MNTIPLSLALVSVSSSLSFCFSLLLHTCTLSFFTSSHLFLQMFHLFYLGRFYSFCILHVSLSGLFILSVQPSKMVYYVSLNALFVYISKFLTLTLKILHCPFVIFLQMKERKSILFTLLFQKYIRSNN
jgi:hypothetical protein